MMCLPYVGHRGNVVILELMLTLLRCLRKSARMHLAGIAGQGCQADGVSEPGTLCWLERQQVGNAMPAEQGIQSNELSAYASKLSGHMLL